MKPAVFMFQSAPQELVTPNQLDAWTMSMRQYVLEDKTAEQMIGWEIFGPHGTTSYCSTGCLDDSDA